MGKSKTARWFRSLLRSNKSSAAAPPPSKANWPPDDYKLKNQDPPTTTPSVVDANKHAIAVAAATAAVAEAALAAAQAAAEVVRLTSSTGSGRNVPAHVKTDRRRVAAVIKIQSAFRSYLARRALRALKGLVKLQALVRGHIVRRQSADMLRRMQAMARIQARASAHRFCVSDSSKPNIKFSSYQPSGLVKPRNYYQWPENAKPGGCTTKQSRMSSRSQSHMESNWLNQWVEQYSWNNRHATTHDTTSRGDDERSAKILEIDTWKPRQPTRRSDRASPTRNETGQEGPKISSFSRLPLKYQKPNPSISSEEVASVVSAKEIDQVAVWTAESSPRVHSASSRPASNRRGMFTPTRSECARSLHGDYLSHPSYMAYTESSRAKVRSQSAPKQRMQLDELGTSSTFGQNAWELDAVSERGYALPSDYRSHSYVKRQAPRTRTPGSSHGICSSHGYRF